MSTWEVHCFLGELFASSQRSIPTRSLHHFWDTERVA